MSKSGADFATIFTVSAIGLQHRDGFVEAWEGAGRFALRLFSSFFVRFELWMTLSDYVGRERQSHPLACRNLIDFRGRALALSATVDKAHLVP